MFEESGRIGFVARGKWVVDTKGGPDCSSFEISVVREDNKHGMASYGWFEDDRKRLISHNGGPCRWPVSEFVWDRLVLIANEYAHRLNYEETTGGESE
jgi:hypothetical protein